MFRVKPSKIAGNLTLFAIVVILLFGGYQIVETQFASKIANVGTLYATSQQQTPSDELKNRSEGNRQERHSFEERGSIEGESGDTRRHPTDFTEDRERRDSSNPLGVIAIFSGIIGIFTISTYYLNRFFTRKKLPQS